MKTCYLIFLALISINHQIVAQQYFDWSEDILRLDDGLRKTHIDLFHSLPEADYIELINILKEDAYSLDTTQFNLRVLEIVSAIGDMHTRASFNWKYKLPLHIFLFKEGFYIRAIDAQYENLLGDEIMEINNIPVKEVFNRVTRLTSADNIYGYYNNSMDLIVLPEILAYLSVVSDPTDPVSLKLRNSGHVELKAETFTIPEEKMIHIFQKSDNEIPLYIKSFLTGPYYYTYRPEHKIFYIQLNTIRNPSEEKSFESLFNEIIEAIDQAAPEKLILDLRWNGGGNDPVYRSSLPKFVAAIIRNNLNSPDKFYTVTGRYTASAAQHLINDLEYLTNTTFIGEPTKQNVHFFSDSRWFTLPNSKIRIAASAGWLQNYIPKGIEDRVLFKPDIFIPWSFESFNENMDPVLNYIESN